MDLAETAPCPGFTSRGLVFALALSIGFHLLIIWRLSDCCQVGWDNHSPFSRQRPLHITVKAPRPQEIARRQATLTDPVTEQNPKNKLPPRKEPLDMLEAEVTPLHATPSKQIINGAIKERTVTTAQIKQSAANVIRDLTDDDREEQEQKLDSVSAILERALNKPSKTPGVYSQADGTTRVVTEQGFTYCIKAPDDWRIIDPGDDLRVSVYCK